MVRRDGFAAPKLGLVKRRPSKLGLSEFKIIAYGNACGFEDGRGFHELGDASDERPIVSTSYSQVQSAALLQLVNQRYNYKRKQVHAQRVTLLHSLERMDEMVNGNQPEGALIHHVHVEL